MKIVFLDADTLGNDVSLESINSLGEYVSFPATTADKTAERMQDCEIVITNKVRIGKKEIDSAPKLKLICEAATGTNNIDVEYALSKNIPVKNVAGYSTESVVQITFMHILNLVGKAFYFDSVVKSGEYSQRGCFTDVTNVYSELYGKNLGIIGLGSIGKRVAEIAKAFGMKISYYSTSGKNNVKEYTAVSLDNLLKESDIISIHAPLNQHTENLITYDKLCMMKKESYIVNMGRGGIVNESDLAKALNNKVISGAAVDVFKQEPLPSDHPYLHLCDKSKMLFSPHIGWASREARIRLIDKIAENIKSIL